MTNLRAVLEAGGATTSDVVKTTIFLLDMEDFAAVNAVYYNRIQDTPEEEREALVAKLREEYRQGVDLLLLASELVVDDVVLPHRLRIELIRRFAAVRNRPRDARPPKMHGVWPV